MHLGGRRFTCSSQSQRRGGGQMPSSLRQMPSSPRWPRSVGQCRSMYSLRRPCITDPVATTLIEITDPVATTLIECCTRAALHLDSSTTRCCTARTEVGGRGPQPRGPQPSAGGISTAQGRNVPTTALALLSSRHSISWLDAQITYNGKRIGGVAAIAPVAARQVEAFSISLDAHLPEKGFQNGRELEGISQVVHRLRASPRMRVR